MLHKEVAVQMFDLVAEGSGRQSLALCLKPVAVAVLGADPHYVGPSDDAPLSGDAQAALQARLLAAPGDDLGVDELNVFPAVLVQYQADPAQHAHLGCRQTSAVGIRQGLRHIVQQDVQVGVELRHGTADLIQAVFAHFHDLTQCHDCISSLAASLHGVAVHINIQSAVCAVVCKFFQQAAEGFPGGAVIVSHQRAAVAEAVVES